MKKRSAFLAPALLASGLFFSTASLGATWFGESADGRWLVGLKGGQVQTDTRGYDDTDNWGLTLGYEFSRPIDGTGSASIEFDYLNTTGSGDIKSSSEFGLDGEWDMDAYGLYFAYRTPGTVFFKGKLGLLNSKIRSDFGTANRSDSDTNFAYGAGLGVRLGMEENINIELDWVGNSGDNDLSFINLGVMLLF
ncbi:MAG: outer membrane beta-barrel protein [Pseudomonadota bacterium]|nr:outer membrane beta-barrel protein [Pseudomonadota bacterium]